MTQYKMLRVKCDSMMWMLCSSKDRNVTNSPSVYIETNDLFLFIEEYVVSGSSSNGYQDIHEIKFLHLKTLRIMYRVMSGIVPRFHSMFEGFDSMFEEMA